MDIFKTLTRGIKQAPGQQAPGLASSTSLPSAGSRPNPQFFHDNVGPQKGRKRKAQNETVVEDEDELNYFASSKGDKDKSKQATDSLPPPPLRPKKRRIRLLDEDACRQTLRSHRLKLTLLGEPRAKKGSKKKGSKKKGRKKGKNENRQIYPQPLSSFSDLDVYGISPQLADNIARQNFTEPTEVQMGSLPLLLRPAMALRPSQTDISLGGIDFMGVAPTGSGKTLSFLIPAITRVLERRASTDQDELDAIVVAPTRELASQIVYEGRKLAAGTGVRIYPVKKGLHITTGYSDEDYDDETDDEAHSIPSLEDEEEDDDEDDDTQPRKGSEKNGPAPDILVATPKSLLNLLARSCRSCHAVTLPTVTSLILDEADVLLDPVFKKQTLVIWRACTHANLNLTFWSATMASSIETQITAQIARRASLLDLPPRPLVRLVVGLKDAAVPNVTHKLTYAATEAGKLLALRQLLHPVSGADSGPPLRPPFLVFTQTVERAQALHDELQYDIPLAAGGSTRIAVLHSALSERARAAVMARFRSGDVWVLVTTDVLARGVDFAGVNGVVSYDVPTSSAAYVHRAGRTGRAGRAGGVAVTLYTKEDIPFVKSVANVIAASERQAQGVSASDSTIQKWLLDALPKVSKADKRRLKTRGVEARRTGGGKTEISTKSSWERRRENNRRGAIEASKRRKREGQQKGAGSDSEWGGLGD